MSSEPAGAEDRRRLVRSLVDAARADPGVDGLAGWLQRLCRAAAAGLPARGAAVHLMTVDVDGVAASSDARARELAELQFTANEGPARVAFATHRPVLVPDLAQAMGRWPGFVSLAAERGVRGVFSFPMQEGAASFGVLEAYADRAGPLDPPTLALAGAFARVATEVVLDDGATTADGGLDPGLTAALRDRDRIHQAQGMLMVELGVPLAEAMSRMRARAFALDVTMAELAGDIIDGKVTAETWIDRGP